MSRWGKLPLAVITDERLTSSDVLVYATVSCHADAHQDWLAEPHVETIARLVRLSVNVVRCSLRRLLDLGWLKLGPRKRRRHTWRVRHEPIAQPIVSAPETIAQPIVPERDIEQTRDEQKQASVAAAPGRPESVPSQPANRLHSSTRQEENPMPRRSDPPQDDLFGAPPAVRKPNGGDLVTVWIDHYRAAHDGSEPPTPLRKRATGHCGYLARDCETPEDWQAALQAVAAAGRLGRFDPMPFMAGPPRSMYAVKGTKTARQVVEERLARGAIPGTVIRGEVER